METLWTIAQVLFLLLAMASVFLVIGSVLFLTAALLSETFYG